MPGIKKYEEIYDKMNSSDKLCSHPIILFVIILFFIGDSILYNNSIWLYLFICFALMVPWLYIVYKRGYLKASFFKMIGEF